MTFSAVAPPAAPPGRFRVPSDDARAERFVAAARELANETGTAVFTVAQVAARARLSLKAFYRCFRGKDDLLIALLATESETGAGMLRARVDAGGEPLRVFVEEIFALATRPDAAGYAGVLVREYRRLTEVRPVDTEAALAPITDLIAAYLASPEPERDARTILSVLLAGMHDVVLGRVDDVPELTHYLYRFCTRGVERG
jgi:AcrR family transcriptional regulator